jgi:hypothetical protein
MSLYYSPEVVKLVMSERLKEAEDNRMAAVRPRGHRQFSFSVRKLVGFRLASSPIAQTCSC